MCASKTNGYQGYKPFAMQQCATLKPGESYEQRATKFSSMGSQITTSILKNRMGRHAYESVAMQNGLHVRSEHYRVPDRRGVSVNEKLPSSKPFIASSTYLHDFPASDEVRRGILHTPLEEYEKAFMAIAQENNQHQGKAIHLCQLQNVLELALDEAQVCRVVDVFHSFLDRRGSVRDQISWELFLHAIDHVNKLIDQELSHCKMPEPSCKTWSDQAVIEKKRNESLIYSCTPASSYKKDYGAYGDNPRDRPYMRKRGMASTTADLNSGTMRMTTHLPGYGGFLPLSSHSTNENNHFVPTLSELRLYHSENIPGYSGHKPVDCANYRGECRAGSDSCTTTGDSYKGHN
ncbi:ptype atpase [Plasmopara halstedii]|uniref:Ptype atpase n=1 Tax=Plasmopara halstedii TaxID=4781 RepID=A0A0P1AIM3_PLAHL|nr:ptype atpase [Plasmopara halstedii]CEG40896.1 ptype atpase [Plasmopara halstedii]|eukprot:XP_024577265.1 ptype atpase [Plasmopara halstedii]